jgi:hypothetical protein
MVNERSVLTVKELALACLDGSLVTTFLCSFPTILVMKYEINFCSIMFVFLMPCVYHNFDFTFVAFAMFIPVTFVVCLVGLSITTNICLMFVINYLLFMYARVYFNEIEM